VEFLGGARAVIGFEEGHETRIARPGRAWSGTPIARSPGGVVVRKGRMYILRRASSTHPRASRSTPSGNRQDDELVEIRRGGAFMGQATPGSVGHQPGVEAKQLSPVVQDTRRPLGTGLAPEGAAGVGGSHVTNPAFPVEPAGAARDALHACGRADRNPPRNQARKKGSRWTFRRPTRFRRTRRSSLPGVRELLPRRAGEVVRVKAIWNGSGTARDSPAPFPQPARSRSDRPHRGQVRWPRTPADSGFTPGLRAERDGLETMRAPPIATFVVCAHMPFRTRGRMPGDGTARE